MGAMDIVSPPKPFWGPAWAVSPEATRAPITSASCSRAAFSTTGKPPSHAPLGLLDHMGQFVAQHVHAGALIQQDVGALGHRLDP